VDATILLVEDDPSIREVTAIGLARRVHGRDRRRRRDGLDRFRGEPRPRAAST
jgi:hypothetical protein